GARAPAQDQTGQRKSLVTGWRPAPGLLAVHSDGEGSGVPGGSSGKGEWGNRSSSAGRTSAEAGRCGPSARTPRTTAAGTPSAFPITSPVAAAISSATATT